MNRWRTATSMQNIHGYSHLKLWLVPGREVYINWSYKQQIPGPLGFEKSGLGIYHH